MVLAERVHFTGMQEASTTCHFVQYRSLQVWNRSNHAECYNIDFSFPWEALRTTVLCAIVFLLGPITFIKGEPHFRILLSQNTRNHLKCEYFHSREQIVLAVDLSMRLWSYVVLPADLVALILVLDKTASRVEVPWPGQTSVGCSTEVLVYSPWWKPSWD